MASAADLPRVSWEPYLSVPEPSDPAAEASTATPVPQLVIKPEEVPKPDIPPIPLRRKAPIRTSKPSPKKEKSVLARTDNQPAMPPPSTESGRATADPTLPGVSTEPCDGVEKGAGHHPASGTSTGQGPADKARQGKGSGPSLPAEFNLEQVDKPPKVVKRVEPLYPHSARYRGISGKVTVKILVGPEGRAESPTILDAQPKGVFDESVLDAVRQWRFTPGYYQGKAVSTWIILPIHFKLT